MAASKRKKGRAGLTGGDRSNLTGLIRKLVKMAQDDRGLEQANYVADTDPVKAVLGVSADYAKVFNDAIELLYNKLGGIHGYAPSTLERRINNLIDEALQVDGQKPTKDLDVAVDKLCTELENAPLKEYDFYYPLEGLSNLTNIDLGDTKITQLSEETYQEFQTNFSRTVDTFAGTQYESREDFKRVFSSEYGFYFQPNKHGTAALCSIKMCIRDIEFGVNQAESRLREVIGVLRFVGATTHGVNGDWSVGLRGIQPLGGRVLLGISEANAINLRLVGASYAVNIESTPGLVTDVLFPIFRKAELERTELESRIVKAVTWYGDALEAVSDGTKVLCACIALEGLLSLNDREGLVNVAERIAFLLSSTSEKRRMYVSELDKVRQLRNRVAHSAYEKFNRAEYEAVHTLMYTVPILILKVAQLASEKGWSKLEDLIEHVDVLKFS